MSQGTMLGARPLVLGTALLGLGCSTLADTTVAADCASDTECEDGFVCAVDQGRCLPGNEAAPRGHLGFDIRERAAGVVRFRVEIDGCDCAVQEAENIRELSLRATWVSQQLQLDVSTTEDVEQDLPARFEVSQPSRFGLLSSRTFVDHAIEDDDGTVSPSPALVRWPRYHLLDEDNPRELILWSIAPESELNLGRRYQGLRPPRTNDDKPCELDTDCCDPVGQCDPFPNYCDPVEGQCTAIGAPEWKYSYPYELACSRGFEGDVVTFDPSAPVGEQHTPLLDANVVVRYADTTTERFGQPAFSAIPLSERPPQCTDDSECVTPDEFCDPTSQQCFLALSGLLAGEDAAAETGTFRTYVYTYCDDEPMGSQQRRFSVTVTPPGPTPDAPTPAPQPSVEVLVDANFFPPQSGGDSVLKITDDFCVPDWGPPASLDLELSGEPRTLLPGEEGYTCCDVGCLPATAEDAELDGPPVPPDSCDERTSAGAIASVRVRSHLTLDLQDLVEWSDAECASPVLDAQGRVGSLTRNADCTDPEAPCRAEAIALGTAEEDRLYEVRVESPVGSVLASGDFLIEVGPEPPDLQALGLAPRALVAGVVDVDATTCGRRDAGEDCAAREAIVIAERLRMPDEPEGGVPGPYFHTTSTFYDPQQGRDGAFVLPLDPGGVYVVTALPAAGAEGGPAGFTVVNLRADAPEPFEDLRLVLEDGVVVTLRLDQFDQRTSVAPVDRGSFLVEGQRLLHPGRLDTVDPFIDLNRVGECWTDGDGEPEACKIRRLIPPGSDLARSQVGVVRFTARRSDQAECLLGCPTPRSEP